MSEITIVPAAELADHVGETFGPSEWVQMTQEKVDQFAEITLDRQFIHIDPEAAKQTPFGGTIAHGYFTMSMVAHFGSQAGVMPENIAMAVNYGMNKLRFLQPVATGKNIRATSKLISVTEKAPGQLLLASEVVVEIEGESKPALIAETLTLVFTG